LLTSFIGLLLLMQISNEVDEEPAPLPSPQPYLHIAALIWVGLLACGAINSWWANLRSDDLLTRTDNPRRAIADRFVLRGTILDRQNRAITTTTGDPGSYSRYYVVPDLSAVAGYTHPIYGQAGLEATLDPYLRGIQGNPALLIWWDHLLYGQPPAGLNVRLSLDIDIQKRADELIGNHAGALVLINAQTGEILAMSSHPTFDANQLDSIGPTLQNSLDGPLLNRATQGQYTIDSAISPLINAAYSQGVPGNSDLLNFYDRLGFYKTPDLRLPSVPAAPKGTTKDLSISPVQMASAVAGLSNQGLCPAPQIASAVETPLEGWVVLPSPGNPIRCLPVDGTKQVTQMLQSKGNLFWEFTSSGTEKSLPVTWYLAGTLSNWSGTPLAIVVVLEANDPALTQKIGRGVLEKAIQP
jgi:hypothetical protein